MEASFPNPDFNRGVRRSSPGSRLLPGASPRAHGRRLVHGGRKDRRREGESRFH
jgi:hypothetical protein